MAKQAKNREMPLLVNTCVKKIGDWLFDDLQKAFQQTKIEGVSTVATEDPIEGADAWVFLRTHEAASSPDLRRTVVCFHDLFQHEELYLPKQPRWVASQAAGLVFCHPHQREILSRAGINLAQSTIMERPLGALRSFTVRETPPDHLFRNQFRIGWVGREHHRKRTAWFADALSLFSRQSTDFTAVLVGKELQALRDRIRDHGHRCDLFDRASTPIEKYPQIYQTLDCLVITSASEAGPLPLFEALATGIPIVSTPVGWAPDLAARLPEFVLLADDPEGIAQHLQTIAGQRHEFFERRFEISAAVEAHRLDDWFGAVLDMAVRLARQSGDRSAHLTVQATGPHVRSG